MVIASSKSDGNPIYPLGSTQNRRLEIIIRIREHAREEAVIEEGEENIFLCDKIAGLVTERSSGIDSSSMSWLARDILSVDTTDE